MSLLSTIANALFGVLPQRLRCPLPRQSEGARDFVALLADESQVQPPVVVAPSDRPVALRLMPSQAPALAVLRRARH